MRILYLNPSGQLGGAERSLLDLLAGLRVARPAWSCEVIASSDGPLLALTRELGAKVNVVTMPRSVSKLGDSAQGSTGVLEAFARTTASGAAIAAYSMRLRAAVRRAAPDIVHSNGFKMHVLGAWTCPRDATLIWHVRDYVGARPLMRRLLPLCAPRCALAIANSDDVASDLKGVCGEQLRVLRIYNGIDLTNFSPHGPSLDLDKLSGLGPAPSGVIRVGLVGTMARWKGHRVFLRALARIPAQVPVRGYVVGGPIYQTSGSEEKIEDLRKEAAVLGLQGRIGFTGFVEEPSLAIRELDVVVHASTEPEAFGRVIAEAMASQKPVVVSRAGGAIELIREEEDALAFTPGDDCALAKQLVRLASNPELRARLARRARKSAVDRFDRGRLTREVVGAYESLFFGRRVSHSQSSLQGSEPKDYEPGPV